MATLQQDQQHDAPQQRGRSWFIVATFLVLVAAVSLFIIQAVGLVLRVDSLNRQAEDLGGTLTERIAESLLENMEQVEGITEEFALELEQGEISPGDLLERLEEASRAHPSLLGLTVAYEPYAYDDRRRLYAPFFNVDSNEVLQCEDYYDYTDTERREDALWYQEAARSLSPRWVTGYGPAAGSTYVGYSLPFFETDESTGERSLKGVVNASVSIQQLNDLLNRVHVGRLGGGILIDADGLLLAHPRRDLIRTGLTFAEVARKNENLKNVEMVERMMAGQSGTRRDRIHLQGNVTGNGWFFFRPLGVAGWSLAVGIFEDELTRAGDELRRRKIGLVLTALVGLMAGSALLLRVNQLNDARLWALSAIDSLLLVIAIAVIWVLAGDRPSREGGTDGDSRPISDLRGLDEFLDEQRKRADQLRLDAPLIIPTAIFVRSLSFQDASHVQVGGTIWQRYTAEIHDDLTRGITFPGVAPDPEALDLEETGRERIGEDEVVSWDFRVLLREQFDYDAFPFDHQHVPIKLGHPDRDKNVLLTPDLKRYQVINTAARPGVATDLVLPGWTVLGSDFSYKLTDYNVLFGDDLVAQADVPVLQYNVLAQRKMLTPFISHIAPLLIVAALLHGVLISSSFNQEKKSNSGFSTFGVLETSGAFFFTIALMHIDLRRGLDLDTITYLESLYITAYFVLLLVAVNSLLFTTTDAVALLEYRDNLVAKLLFWPITLGIVLTITVITFG